MPDEFLHYNDQRKDFPIIHATYTHQGILSFSSELFLPPRWKKFGSRGSQKKKCFHFFGRKSFFPFNQLMEEILDGSKLKVWCKGKPTTQKVWNGFEKFATFLELKKFHITSSFVISTRCLKITEKVSFNIASEAS